MVAWLYCDPHATYVVDEWLPLEAVDSDTLEHMWEQNTGARRRIRLNFAAANGHTNQNNEFEVEFNRRANAGCIISVGFDWIRWRIRRHSGLEPGQAPRGRSHPPRLFRTVEEASGAATRGDAHRSGSIGEPIFLRCETRVEVVDTRHKIYHKVQIWGNEHCTAVTRRLQSVTYAFPNQGFRRDTVTKDREVVNSHFGRTHTFDMEWGPCWGRPHVTITVKLCDGTEPLFPLFEGNLFDSGVTVVCIYDPRNGDPPNGVAEPASVEFGQELAERLFVEVDPLMGVENNDLPFLEFMNEGTEETRAGSDHSVPGEALQSITGRVVENPEVLRLPPLEHGLDPESVADHLVCCISYHVFRDPVICTDGHTYERAAIQKWFETKRTSPMTNSPMGETMITNMAVRQQIEGLIAQSKAAHGGQTAS